MFRRLLMSLALVSSVSTAHAETIESAYTDINVDKTCTMFDVSEGDEGQGASFACAGYMGYPVLIFAGDLRESVFFGFPPAGDLPWESFDAFNGAGAKVEWRIATDGDKRIPFATILRWTVNDDPENSEKKTEVLVVEKVAQFEGREGCAVGYVVATGNAKANETARKIADEQAREFSCGADEPVQVGGSTGVPGFSR